MTISLQQTNHWSDTPTSIFESLRPRAQRLIESLRRRMKLAQDKSFYLEEIERVIAYEHNRAKNRKRGDDID